MIMDLYYVLLLLSIALSLPLSILFFLPRSPARDDNNNNNNNNHRPLPPGSLGWWPPLGETLEFVFSGRRGRPEGFFSDRMDRHSARVFKTSLFGENMAVFCGDSGNKFLFSNEGKLVSSWWPRSVVKVLGFPNSTSEIDSTAERHRKMRSFLPEFLKPEALQSHVAVMDLMARKHLEEEWVPNKEVKVFPLCRKYTFSLACRLFMSIEDPTHVSRISDSFALVTSGLISVPVNFSWTSFGRAVKAGEAVRGEILAVVRKRKAESTAMAAGAGGDLLSRMLVAGDEEGELLKEVEISSIILALLIASHDTASTTITFVLYFLADHPHVYARVFREQMEIASAKGDEELLNWEDVQKMKYSWSVANETLRLAPPSLGAFREAISDFTYAGFTIPKGWKTHWSVHSTHKNPKYFRDPERFDPSRFEGKGPAPYTFVPFGGGPRMCGGREYARLEILVFIHNVVTKFKWEKLVPNEKIKYVPSPSPEEGLPVLLHLH